MVVRGAHPEEGSTTAQNLISLRVPTKVKNIVVVGDLHLHFWSAFASGHGAENTRFQKTLENLRLSLDKARELKCPWLQAGDWVHTVGFTRNAVLTYLIELLTEYGDVEKFTVWGNHDARTAGDQVRQEETVVEVLRQTRVVIVLNGGVVHETRNGLRIYGEGYQPNPGNLKICHIEPGALIADVGLFHQTVVGSQLPSGMRMEGGLPPGYLFSAFKLAVVGDIHKPQHFSDGEFKNILVPGSLEQHNFGDLEPRGWWVVDVDLPLIPFTASCRFFPSTSPKFLTVEGPKDVKKDGNFYRVTSPCHPSELPEGVVAVASPPVSVVERNAIAPGASTREVLESWIKLVPPSVSTPTAVIEEGLRLLEAEGPVTLRPIRLRKAVLHNFLCYSEAVFEIKDGVTLVTGSARDYTSNGAGKTTLFEAIFWALFGRTTKGVGAEEVIQRGKDATVVELVFDDLKVARTRNKNGESELAVHEGDTDKVWGGTPKDVTAALQKFLGLTPELFQALTYFSQSRLVLFSQATDSERKGMLSDLCGLEIYQSAATAARAQAEQLKQSTDQISLKIDLLSRAVQETDALRTRLQLKAEEWAQEATTQLVRNQDELEKTKSSIVQLKERWRKVEEKLGVHADLRVGRVEFLRPSLTAKYTEKYQGNVDRAKTALKMWREANPTPADPEVLIGRRKEISEALAPLRAEFSTLQTEVANHTRTVQQYEAEVQRLKGRPDKCPTCGQVVGTSTRDRLLEEVNLKLAGGRSYLDEANLKVAGFADIATSEKQLVMIDELLQKQNERSREEAQYLNSFHLAENILENQVAVSVKMDLERFQAAIRNRIEGRKKSMGSAVRIALLGMERSSSQLLNTIHDLQTNPYEGELEKATGLLAMKETELATVRESVAATTTKMMVMQYWATGLSRSGIQSLLMEEIAASFNQIRSAVFPILTRGVYDVQFSTTSTTKDGGAREKTDFILRDRGALVSYESLSGGQRRRIDLGVMLTLSMAVAKTRQVPGVLGMLVLDEVFAFLDEDGVDALFSVLGEVNQVIPSIYAVTHNPNLQSLFTATLKVEQDQYGVSRILEKEVA